MSTRARERKDKRSKLKAAIIALLLLLFLSVSVLGVILIINNSQADEPYNPPPGGGYEVPEYPDEDECDDEHNDDCDKDLEDCDEADDSGTIEDDECDDEPLVRTKVVIPSLVTDSFVFGGVVRTVTLSDSGRFFLSGSSAAINVGTYFAVVTLECTESYKWADGTAEPISLEWAITRAYRSVAQPTFGGSLTFGDSLPSISTTTEGGTIALVAGQTLLAGTHTYNWVFVPDDTANIAWSSLTGTIELTAVRQEVAMPSLVESGFVFDGSQHSVSLNSSANVTLGGTTGATNVGTYTATVSLNDRANLVWADGSDGDIDLVWGVEQGVLSPIAPSDIAVTFGDYDSLHDITIPGWRWTAVNQALNANGEGQVFVLRYIDSESANFVTHESTVRVTVAQATPVVVAPTGLGARFGDTLSSVELPSASWSWVDGTISVGEAGNRVHDASYTPKSTNYHAVTVGVSVGVVQATPGYVLPTGLEAFAGTSDMILKSVALPTGWTWISPEVSVGEPGTREHRAIYTPYDTDNFSSVERTLTVEVIVFTYISGGSVSVLAIDSLNRVWTWGEGWVVFGHTGAPSIQIPTRVAGLYNIMAVATGGHNMALGMDGSLWTWGNNSHGQLGIGTIGGSITAPRVVDTGAVRFDRISVGNNHSMALDTQGRVWTWGNGQSGRTGHGDIDNRPIPTMIAGLSNVTAISAGFEHSMVLDSHGRVWMWGRNWRGQLGDGTIIDRHTPIQTIYFGTVTAIATATGDTAVMALDSHGRVWMWGNNTNGQLGIGVTGGSMSVPTQLNYFGTITAIATGGSSFISHSMALDTNGNIWVWGSGDLGQLGNGLGTNSNLPVQANHFGSVTAIASTNGANIALDEQGRIWTWGSGRALGHRSTNDEFVPRRIGSN